MRTEQICEIDFAVKWVDIVAVLVDLVIADGHDNVTDLHSGFHRGRVRLDIRYVNAARFACLTGVFPQLRKYAGQTGKAGGVYVTNVEPNTPAMKAGMQVGDVIMSIGNHEIDQNGNYVDPLYGKIDFTNLLSAHSYAGDVVAFQIQREGKPMELKVTLEHRDPKDYVSPPYALDEAPKYLVLGGLIFQELSRQYLKEWGPNWQREAPQRFVYLDRFQSELFPEGNRRVVILSQVLPANSTIGYDDLAYLTVTKVNGKEIKSLDDLAQAVKQPIEGFIKIEPEEDPKQIELDAAQVAAEAPELQENYGISCCKG